jgi:hypothetical protein
MISVKVAIALSMVGVGASTFGVGAYVSSRSSAPVKSAQVEEVEVARVPLQTRFEVAPATSIGATRSTEAKVLMLEPVLIYGRNFVRHGPEPATSSD